MNLRSNGEGFLSFTLVGSPGSGKGTQAKMLQQTFGFRHVSTGDLCRDAAHRQAPNAELVESLISKGELVPDELIFNLLAEHIRYIQTLPESPSGVILDGYPRNIQQAERIDELNDHHNLRYLGLIYIQVPEDIVMDRLSKRQEERQDDHDEVIRERIRIFQDVTLPLVDYVRGKYRVAEIDGLGAPEEVFQRIVPVIQDWQKIAYQQV